MSHRWTVLWQEIDLSSPEALTFDVAGYSFARVQVVPIDYTATAAVLAVEWSIAGVWPRADALSPAVAINPDRSISDPIDVRRAGALHVRPSTTGTGLAGVYVFLSTRGHVVEQDDVTAHEAALTIAESQITDGSLLARIADNETITGAWTLTGATTINGPLVADGGASFASTPVGGFFDAPIDGGDRNLILGSWDIVHKADARHTTSSTGLKNLYRAFGLGEPNFVLSDGSTATPQFTVTFDKTGFSSANVYLTTAFMLTFSASQTLPTEIKIEGQKTSDSSWYTIINDTSPSFGSGVTASGGSTGRYWSYATSIGYGSRLDAVRVTLTFASTPANNDVIFDEFFMLNQTGSLTFALVQQGGPLNMELSTGTDFGVVVESSTKHKDNVKAFFGNGKDASIYYDGADMRIKGDVVGSGSVIIDSPIEAPSLKSGTSQAAAGAAAGELWHDTTDHTIKIGV